MIEVVQEPDARDLAALGSERCCFCWRSTSFWNPQKDVPVCRPCAGLHEIDEVPTKDAWWEAVEQRRAAARRN